MKYIVSINGKNYEVEVERGKASIVGTTESTVQAAQSSVISTSAQANAAPAPQAVVQSNVAGEAVKAPMPGTILSIKVKQGTTVKKGDVLFILEAMKMENEIVAPKDGIVSIAVASGASVATGDVLAAIQ